MTTVENIVNFVTNWRQSNGINSGGILSETQTVQLATDLQVEVNKMSFDPPTSGSKIIPYNGYIGNTLAWKIAEGASSSNRGKLFYISDLEPGKLLNNEISGLENALEVAVGDPNIASELIQGSEINGVRSPNGVKDVLSINDYVSKKAMEANAKGDMIVFMGKDAEGKIPTNNVWTQTELPELLNKTDVKSINGIQREELLNTKKILKETFNYTEEAANKMINERISLNFETHVKPDIGIDIEEVNGQKTVKAVDMSKAADVPEVPKTEGIERKILNELDGELSNQELMQKHKGLNDLAEKVGMDSDLFRKTANASRKLDKIANNLPTKFKDVYNGMNNFMSKHGKTGAKVLGRTFVAGMELFDFYNTYQKADELHKNGQAEEGNKLILGWAAKAYSAAVGAEVAMAAVAPYSLALITCGGPAGIAIGTTIQVGAGIIGGIYGHKFMDKLLTSLQNLFGAGKLTISPLVFDLDGDGVETTSMDAITHFDHDSNGFAEKTCWVSPDDGLLVYDRNNNGFIDNGTELFGDYTPGNTTGGGFEALTQFDTNNDGVINGEGDDLILFNIRNS